MKCALIGFPKVGKTTVFNLLTRQQAETDKYATSRRGPNVGQASVPDRRVELLSELFKPRKTTFAQVDYVDVAGVEEGELKDSMDLGPVRNTDMLLHVVRAFDDPELPHAPGALDPRRDIESMEAELQIADLIVVEKRLERIDSDLRKGRKGEGDLPRERELLERCRQTLEQGQPLRSLGLLGEDERMLRGYQFLSAKPLLVLVNLGEEQAGLAERVVEEFGLEQLADWPLTALSQVQGQLEMEIARLEDADREAFMQDLGLSESGLDRVIRSTYELLGLISFFTVGEDEVRAWTIRRDTPAVEAAGAIHSDLARGFIRAEVVPAPVLLEHTSLQACKQAGLLRLEGKDYVVQDGDVMHVRFNVG